MRISDWSSDVCSSDLRCRRLRLLEYAPRKIAGQRTQIIVVAAACHRREPGQARCGGHANVIARSFGFCVGCEKLRILIDGDGDSRSEEHTSELQSLMRTSYAVFCLKNTNINYINTNHQT